MFCLPLHKFQECFIQKLILIIPDGDLRDILTMNLKQLYKKVKFGKNVLIGKNVKIGKQIHISGVIVL